MRKILTPLLAATMLFFSASCGNLSAGQTAASGCAGISPNCSGDSDTVMQIRISDTDGQAIDFRLNDSPAAKSLYAQLPLTVGIENFGSNEKIFYPPEKLEAGGTPMAEGPAGTLAYYEPWGNVAIFYADCGGASGLYELGEAVSGIEWIGSLTGEITLEKTGPDAGSAETAPGIEDNSIQQSEAETEIHDMISLQMAAGNQSYTAKLYDNAATRALIKQLPLTLSMTELNGNEKFCFLSSGLPAAPHRPGRIEAGDLMLYGSDCLVLFYDSFSTSYAYTPLGHIVDAAGLAAALGGGSVEVAFTAG